MVVGERVQSAHGAFLGHIPWAMERPQPGNGRVAFKFGSEPPGRAQLLGVVQPGQRLNLVRNPLAGPSSWMLFLGALGCDLGAFGCDWCVPWLLWAVTWV